MKLAVSSLAWAPERDEEVAVELQRFGVEGIELVPTKYYPDLLNASPAHLAALKEAWEIRGFSIPALQAILFGRTDLQLFAEEPIREALLAFLTGTAELAARLGAGALVLGAPKNRARNGLSKADAEAVAGPWFKRLAAAAESAGVCFCLEPVPEVYGCDFVVNTQEAAYWVEKIDAPGLRLNLDTSAMALAGEDLFETMTAFGHLAGHVHLSAEGLGPVAASSGIDYAAALAGLQKSGYDGWVSIEMKPAEKGGLDHVLRALEYIPECWP